MKIVALDSSGLVASVAVAEDGCLIAEANIQYKKNHSTTLLPLLADLGRLVELDFATVDAIALAAGPGSFTGLRIGAATAKGLGFALQKPLIEIPTADGLAYNLYGCGQLVCPLMDARRNQVYTGLYAFEKAAAETPIPDRLQDRGAEPAGWFMKILLSQCAMAIEEIAGFINEQGREVIFLGDGVPVYENQLSRLLTVPYSLAPFHMNRQRAAALAGLAFEYLARGKTVTAAEHTPVYLRLSQAEREKADMVKIRPMETADVAVISEMEARTFSMPWKAADFLEMISADYAYYYVAELGRQPVGGCGMRNILGEGQITNVVVAEQYRGRKIGCKLMQYMLTDAAARGVKNFTLEVRASNQIAISLYESLGFVRQGYRPDFYEKPLEDAVIMNLIL